MLKVGILGAGFMGGTHARAFAKQPQVQIVGISSQSADKAARLAAEVGAQPFTDAMALATRPEIDAISITLPTHLHQDYAVAALNAGKHVLVEKPMALTIDECDTMIEAARKNNRTLMVAHVLRFWPEYVALADFLQAGQLGRPLSVTASRLSTRPNWGEWFANPDWTGGAVLDLHIHDLDILNWLFGPPQTIYAQGLRGPAGGWDHMLTVADYNGVKAFVEGSVLLPAGYPFTMTLWVLCEYGSVEFTFRAGGTGVETGTSSGTSLVVYEAGREPRPLPVAAGDGYERQVAHFVESLRQGRPPDQGTAGQGRLAVLAALAVRLSLETGQVISL